MPTAPNSLTITAVRSPPGAASRRFKSVVFPEWWLYAPVPLCFTLLAVEFVRRLTGR
ncbi:hypothetical protein D3C83_115350 [compost metagenome]